MVIEANKEEALNCLQKAKQAMLEKDEAKMKRLLEKALRLDPNCDVKSYLQNYTSQEHKQSERNGPERSYSHDDHYEDPAGLRNRSHKFRQSQKSTSKDSSHDHDSRAYTKPSSSTSSRPRSKSAGRSAKDEYSADDLQAVERIRHCKDYYEILQVSRDFTEVQLKKKYREMALKLHPDKCKAPGATEAFKALGNAYTVLSDSKKKADYDRYGAEGAQSPSRRHNDFYDYDVSRGFEAEMSPEDIFEMFFGGGFPSGSVYRRGRTHFQFRRNYEEPRHEDASLLANVLHILPLILLLVGGLVMQLLVSDPAYSLSRDSTYSVARQTKDLRVPYFVKPNFETEYRNKIRQVEQHVEDEYLNQLRMKCYKEKNHQESLLWTAKIRGDSELWRRAQNMDLPSCKKLQEIYH